MCEMLWFVFANFGVAGKAMDGRANVFLRVWRGGTRREDLSVGFLLGTPQEKNRAHGCGAARDPLGINR